MPTRDLYQVCLSVHNEIDQQKTVEEYVEANSSEEAEELAQGRDY